jgi:hypothetical protein
MAAGGENRWPYLGRNRWPLTRLDRCEPTHIRYWQRSLLHDQDPRLLDGRPPAAKRRLIVGAPTRRLVIARNHREHFVRGQTSPRVARAGTAPPIPPKVASHQGPCRSPMPPADAPVTLRAVIWTSGPRGGSGPPASAGIGSLAGSSSGGSGTNSEASGRPNTSAAFSASSSDSNSCPAATISRYHLSTPMSSAARRSENPTDSRAQRRTLGSIWATVSDAVISAGCPEGPDRGATPPSVARNRILPATLHENARHQATLAGLVASGPPGCPALPGVRPTRSARRLPCQVKGAGGVLSSFVVTRVC